MAAKLLPRIWCTPLPWRIRIEATVHLLGNLAFLPMVLLIFLLPLAATIRNTTSIAAIELLDFPLFVAATLNLAIFYLFAQREARGPRTFWRSLPRIPLVLGVGAALSLNNLRAVFRALCGAQTPFVRTPKHGEGPRIQKAGPRLDLQSLVESLFGVYLLLATGGLLAWHGWSHSLPFLALFGFSFLHLGLRDRRAQSVARFS